jgi:hypothetical protein
VIEIDLKRLPKVEKCYHNSKKLLEKKLINCELLCSAFCSMIIKLHTKCFTNAWTVRKSGLRLKKILGFTILIIFDSLTLTFDEGDCRPWQNGGLAM